jgi:hypothetical protein
MPLVTARSTYRKDHPEAGADGIAFPWKNQLSSRRANAPRARMILCFDPSVSPGGLSPGNRERREAGGALLCVSGLGDVFLTDPHGGAGDTQRGVYALSALAGRSRRCKSQRAGRVDIPWEERAEINALPSIISARSGFLDLVRSCRLYEAESFPRAASTSGSCRQRSPWG